MTDNRPQGERINRRKLADDLTDLMARLLHYQEHGEPDYTSMACAEINALPNDIVQRYRNDPIFHARVQRAVGSIMCLIHDAEERV